MELSQRRVTGIIARNFAPRVESKKRRIAVYSAVIVGILATIFDAVMSWQTISVNPIAVEGNPLLSSMAHLIGFGGTMAIRGLWGVVLLLSLFPIALYHIEPRGRRLAGFGIYLTSSVLFLLALYHIWGNLVYG